MHPAGMAVHNFDVFMMGYSSYSIDRVSSIHEFVQRAQAFYLWACGRRLEYTSHLEVDNTPLCQPESSGYSVALRGATLVGQAYTTKCQVQ